MIDWIWEQTKTLLALDSSDLSALEMMLRAAVVYPFALVVVRLGSKRFLAEATAFDVIVAIMLGSIMSRAITGSGPFVPTLLAGAGLVAMHWLFSALAVHTEWFGTLVKGTRRRLIKDGKVQEQEMEEAGLTSADLGQALREQISRDDPSGVARAYLERDGKISVIPGKREPRVLDVSVRDGVKTVRIELG